MAKASRLKTQARVDQRILRLELGNFGDYKSLGKGLHELRLSFGSGYRVYYGNDGDAIVVLLCGGDKSSQKADITKARIYWQEYQENKND